MANAAVKQEQTVSAQFYLNEVRAGRMNALMDFRYFIFEKYRPILIKKHPDDDILFDPRSSILSMDMEIDPIIFEWLHFTNLSDSDTQCLVFLDTLQEYNKRKYQLGNVPKVFLQSSQS